VTFVGRRKDTDRRKLLVGHAFEREKVLQDLPFAKTASESVSYALVDLFSRWCAHERLLRLKRVEPHGSYRLL
jgi:hypothetical protein